MLSNVGIKGLGSFFRAAWFMKSLPFVWDQKAKVLSIKYAEWSFFLWLFLSAVESINGVRSLFDFFYCALFPEEIHYISQMLLALHLTFASGQILGLLFTCNLLCKMKENIHCYNQLLRANNDIWDKLREEKAVRKALDSKRVYLWTNKLMHGLVPWLLSMFLFNSAFVLLDSQDRRWGWHLFSSSRRLSFPLAFWAIYEGYLFNLVYGLVAVYFFIFPIVFTQNINYWLEFLSVLSSKKSAEKCVEKQIEAYRYLVVLMTLYNDAQSQYAWPIFIGANIYFHVLCNFVCIKFSSTMNIAGMLFLGTWSLSYLMIDYFAFPIGGRVFETSEDMLRKWRERLRRPVRVRQVRALRPLAVRIGGMFTMGNTTPLEVMQITTNVTLNLLLLNLSSY